MPVDSPNAVVDRVALAVSLMVLGWLGIARSEELCGGSGRHSSAETNRLVVDCAWRRCWWPRVPSYRVLARWSYAAFLSSLVLLVAVYLVSAGQRCAALDSLRSGRLAAVGVRQAGVRAGAGAVPDVSRQLPPARRTAGAVGAGDGAGGARSCKSPTWARSLVFLPVLFVMLFAAGARRRHLALLVAGRAGGVAALVVADEPRAEVAHHGAWPSRRGRRAADRRRLSLAPGQADPGVWAAGGAVWPAGEAHASTPALRTCPSRIPTRSPWCSASVSGCVGLGRCCWAVSAARVARAGRWRRRRANRSVGWWPIGIAALLATQVLINTGMLVGLLPITGLALPLVSYGGSSLLANCAGAGPAA